MYSFVPPCFARLYRTLDVADIARVAADDGTLVQRRSGLGFERLRSRGLIAATMADAADAIGNGACGQADAVRRGECARLGASVTGVVLMKDEPPEESGAPPTSPSPSSDSLSLATAAAPKFTPLPTPPPPPPAAAAAAAAALSECGGEERTPSAMARMRSLDAASASSA